MTRNIPLTRGQQAIVDDEDYDILVSMGKWMAISGNVGWYAARNRSAREKRSGLTGFIFMHNVILPTSPGNQVDHIDRNGLNNSQNMMNQDIRKDNTSGHRGVNFDKSRGKWRAELWNKGKRFYSKRFEKYGDAVDAYAEQAKALYGEFVS